MAYTDVINPKHPASIITIQGGKITPRDDRPLSLVPLAEKKDKFFEHIEKNYSLTTIKNYRWCVNKIISSGPRGFCTYNQLLEKYTRKNIRSYLIQIMLYDFYDILPSSERLFLNTTYYKLSAYYQELIDDIIRCRLADGISETTINVEVGKTAKFFKYLQDCGITNIHDIYDKTIREYVIYGTGDNEVIHRIGNTLSSYAVIHSDDKLKQIVKLFPPATVRKKVYAPLLSKEREKIEEFLTNPDSDISKRDRAIGILLFYTGLRSSDIRNMKRTDIDLKNEMIHIIQKKTGVHVRIPLRPIISNAIVDYVKNERPRNDSPYLFLGKRIRKSGQATRCNIYKVIDEIYDKTGTRLDGVRRGTHLLRHAVADKMLNEGTDISVISRVLGHSDPNTTIGYINANIEQLRACSLPISSFPIKSKLYED